MGLVTSVAGLEGINIQQVNTIARKESSAPSFQSIFTDKAQNGPESMDAIFEEAAARYDVSVDLLKAVAKAESGFNPNAVSKAGAIGVMQLMPATARSLGVADPYDARQNIMGGAQYISRLLEKYNGNLSFAVAAYNAGSGNVDKYGGIPPFNETQNYVVKVLRYLEEGVTIPDSSGSAATGVSTGASAGWSSLQSAGSSSSTGTLQNILNKYFDYDDYLEFLQLFTRVIYEKLTGEALETKPASQEQQEQEEQNTVQQVQQPQAEPAKILTMKVKDAQGRIQAFQQSGESADDAYQAFQYMTAGGQNRMSVFLNKTV